MSRGTPTDPTTDDPQSDDQPEDRDIDHASIPDSFITTIRVERTLPSTYRATQHDVDVEGYGSSPHLAIIDFVRRAERSCFGDGGSTDGEEATLPGA